MANNDITTKSAREVFDELLADADVILATIIGRALVESALSSTPIVAYDCEWHAEFITEGTTGLLVPLGDTAAMGEGALALLSDSSRAAKIGSVLERRWPS